MYFIILFQVFLLRYFHLHCGVHIVIKTYYNLIKTVFINFQKYLIYY